MITIEHLEVLFDAEQQRDEAVFAQLFTRHIDAWQRTQHQDREAGAQAQRDRSLGRSRGAGSA